MLTKGGYAAIAHWKWPPTIEQWHDILWEGALARDLSCEDSESTSTFLKVLLPSSFCYQKLHLFLLAALKIPLAVPLINITAHTVAEKQAY